ncbi:CHD3-type chromatin-remodeling factor PICKLE-like isoform X3 [Humulus lupulus]|uniref:CHD3-type chromatin-remodeling factor PICKLE-like isoform X3 n=1 Tax=Humulus lupulus TaxID=3486 RepID=UPI002B4067BA|nr:CHD3-type chromatin-remodeling factor PICKLE-like isoform X3 [Humulus lupulus]
MPFDASCYFRSCAKQFLTVGIISPCNPPTVSSNVHTRNCDGVPKDGLRTQDVLVRIAVLMLAREKVKFALENPGAPLYADDIQLRYQGLKGGKFWKEEHDLLLLRAVLKYIEINFCGAILDKCPTSCHVLLLWY